MKYLSLFGFYISLVTFSFSQLTVTEIGQLPEPVSNNAVCEGIVGDTTFIYSFGGIDSSKVYSGIHLRSFKVNSITGETTLIPDLPDTLGKIACSANRIGDVIYITGGYHVFSNGGEATSTKIHRYDILADTFLTDGAELPLGTDDHVQVVWKDSLLILVTGWNNAGNINRVQLYNPTTDSWELGNPVPNNHDFKSFGASGGIIGDTLYYFGGAASSSGFGIQNQLRKGVINPNDPLDIAWSFSVPEANINGYRMACTKVRGEIHWVGGSTKTYNFNGIAYNGTGGVNPSNRDLVLKDGGASWSFETNGLIPMDLRGIASENDTVKYLVGGMTLNQKVSDKILRLHWAPLPLVSGIEHNDKSAISAGPIPFNDFLVLNRLSNDPSALDIEIYDLTSRRIYSTQMTDESLSIPTSDWSNAVYYVKISSNGQFQQLKLLKAH